MTFRLRRGTDAERQTVTFAEGELIYVTDTQEVYVGDGTTAGGNRVTGSVNASPASLTQNLNMNSKTINGTGTIAIAGSVTATNFVGDGSGLTGVDASLVEGQTYAININGDVISDDSTVLIDVSAGTISGDGSGLTQIQLNQLDDVTALSPNNNDVLAYIGGAWTTSDVASIYTGGGSGGQGVVEGQTYDINITGDVLSDSSTILVNTATSTFTGNLTGNVTGDITGDVTGDVTGNLTGNVTGNVTGDVTGTLIGDVTGDITGGNYYTQSSTLLIDGDSGVFTPTRLESTGLLKVQPSTSNTTNILEVNSTDEEGQLVELSEDRKEINNILYRVHRNRRKKSGLGRITT